MRARGLLLTIGTICAVLAAAGSAHGAVTIGSNLTTPTGPADNMPGCNVACTAATLGLPAANTAPGGLTSPVNGTVTSWRVGSGSSGNSIALRVLRPAGALTFTGAGVSAPGTTVTGIAGPFATSMPIRAGDSIGLENPAAALVLGVNLGATQVFWNLPPLAEGSTRLGSAGAQREVLVQATVEPDNQLDIKRIVRNKKKGIAKLIVEVPNAGQLKVGGKLLKVKGPSSTAAGESTIVVNVKAKKKKLKKLKKKGKVGAKPVLTFTPTFGVTSSKAVKFGLKKKRKKGK